MPTTITFSNGANSVTVNTPQYGYTARPIMSLKYARLSSPTYDIWDNGVSYDVRLCTMSRFLLNTSDQSNLNAFFSDASKGRGNTVNMALGSKSTGFYPFGPDKGDVGTFTVKAINYDQTGQLLKPWKYWETDITFLMITAPAYSLPAETNDGNLQIGTVTGIKYPQDAYNSTTEYAIDTLVTLGGSGYEVDRSTDADRYETSFQIEGKQNKIAALVDYIMVTARASNFTMITSTDNYPFGHDKGGNGTYTVQLLSPELRIVHMGFNRFMVDFKLNFISVA